MKFIQFCNKHEGKGIPPALISMGRCIDSRFGKNGFYLRFVNPKKVVTEAVTASFEVGTYSVQKCYYWSTRKAGGVNRVTGTTVYHINDKLEAVNIDPDAVANTKNIEAGENIVTSVAPGFVEWTTGADPE
jgi:hypothetical protein